MFTVEQYDHGFRSAQYMERNGGSFASNLAKAYYRADWGHAEILYKNFPHILALPEFKEVEKEYSVLITASQYRIVKAKNAEQARKLAYDQYMSGDLELDATPEFSCEECDEVKNA